MTPIFKKNIYYLEKYLGLEAGGRFGIPHYSVVRTNYDEVTLDIDLRSALYFPLMVKVRIWGRSADPRPVLRDNFNQEPTVVLYVHRMFTVQLDHGT